MPGPSLHNLSCACLNIKEKGRGVHLTLTDSLLDEHFVYMKNVRLVGGKKEIANSIDKKGIENVKNCEDWCRSYNGCVMWAFFKGAGSADKYCSLINSTTCELETNARWESGFPPTIDKFALYLVYV